MPVSLVVGAQWGDEGKGRIVDYLSRGVDAVARYGGGANAGHTVKVGDKTYKLRLVPSGVVAGVDACIIGPGTVVSPQVLIDELEALGSAGIDISRVWISDLAHLIMPYHVELDRAAERARGDAKIGTTGNGIGPAYVDRVARRGIRAGDLRSLPEVRVAVTERCRELAERGIITDPDAIVEQLERLSSRLLPHVCDSVSLLHTLLRAGKRVLAEGAQGTMLDVTFGTYPYVTSSSTLAGGSTTGLGFGPGQVDHVVGVTKAYATRVGGGPFPSELDGVLGETLRTRGSEFGVVTGRSRRCGWLDLAALRYAVAVNGITHLAMTKLDVLDAFDEIGVCMAYAEAGDASLPFAMQRGAVPVMRTLPGWQMDTSAAREWSELPERARDFVSFVESDAGVPVSYVSVGPERSQIITRAGAPLSPEAVAR